MSLDFVTVEDNQFTVLDDELYPWAIEKLREMQEAIPNPIGINLDLGYVSYKQAYQLLPAEQEQRNKILKACRNLFFDELNNVYGKQSRLVVIDTKDYKWKDTQ